MNALTRDLGPGVKACCVLGREAQEASCRPVSLLSCLLPGVRACVEKEAEIKV